MRDVKRLCPVCRSSRLIMKYEAKYVYSYVIDDDEPGLKNETEFLPFLYDTREQVEADQYIECGSCGARFPFIYPQANKGSDPGKHEGDSDIHSDSTAISENMER